MLLGFFLFLSNTSWKHTPFHEPHRRILYIILDNIKTTTKIGEKNKILDCFLFYLPDWWWVRWWWAASFLLANVLNRLSTIVVVVALFFGMVDPTTTTSTTYTHTTHTYTLTRTNGGQRERRMNTKKQNKRKSFTCQVTHTPARRPVSLSRAFPQGSPPRKHGSSTTRRKPNKKFHKVATTTNWSLNFFFLDLQSLTGGHCFPWFLSGLALFSFWSANELRMD